MRNAHRINYKAMIAQYIVYVNRKTLYLENKIFSFWCRRKREQSLFISQKPMKRLCTLTNDEAAISAGTSIPCPGGYTGVADSVLCAPVSEIPHSGSLTIRGLE